MKGSGELVSGAMAGQSASEVSRRIETLGLVLVETLTVEDAAPRRSFGLFNQPRAEDVTVFTRDLGLLLRAGARVNDGLELLAGDSDIGRLRPEVARVPSIMCSKCSPPSACGPKRCGASSPRLSAIRFSSYAPRPVC